MEKLKEVGLSYGKTPAVAIAWALSNENFALALIGPSTLEHLLEN